MTQKLYTLAVKAKTMRCPKCGFISFDHQETCSKCGKNIAALTEQLSGTVYKAEPPAFLKFEVHHAEEDAGVSVDEVVGDDIEFSLDGEDLVMEVEEEPAGEEFEFEEVSPAAESGAEDDFDFQLTDEESGELDLVADDTEVAAEASGPQIDFSELDISDLGPPESETEEESEELSLDDAPEAPAAAPEHSPSSLAGGGGTLEDLQTEGLDLGMPSLPPAGSSTGKKLRPGVKTGTALDEFDIDLGELLSAKEK